MRKELSFDTAVKADFTLVLVITLFMAAYSTNASGGLLSHAASGRLISGAAQDPSGGGFSFAVPASRENTGGWLFDVFAFSTVKLFGPGLAFVPLFIFLCCLCGVIYMTLFRKQEGKYLSVTIPLAVFGLVLLSPYRGLNSVFMSVLFASFLIFCLSYEPKKKNLMLWYAIPFIVLVWVNMHKTGMLAPLIYIIFAFFYSAEAGEVYEKQKLYSMKTVWMVFILTVLACLMQPGGYNNALSFYASLFTAPFHAGHFYSGAKHVAWYVLFYLYCLLGFTVFLYSTRGHGTDIGRKGTEARDSVLFLILLVLAIRDAAFIPVFMAVSIPFTAYYSFLIFRWDYAWPRKMTEIQLIRLEAPVYLAMSVILVISCVMLAFVKRPSYPAQSAEYILKNPVPVNMFVPYEWGSYAEYALYPAYRVLSSERFGPDSSVSREAYALENLYEGWRDTVSRYGINSFLLPRESKLGAMLASEGFLPVYFNDREIIYADPGMQVKALREFNPDIRPGFDVKYARKAFAEASAFAENFPTAASVSEAARILKSYSVGDAIDYLQDQIETNTGIKELRLELARVYLENGEFENAIEAALSFVPPNAESARIASEARKKLVRREEIQ